MHKVAIYLRREYQSQASVVSCPDHCKTIQHVNKHETVFHNLHMIQTYECSCPDQTMLRIY